MRVQKRAGLVESIVGSSNLRGKVGHYRGITKASALVTSALEECIDEETAPS